MQRNDERREDDLIDLGSVIEETKGSPVVGAPDTIDLQKFGDGISDD